MASIIYRAGAAVAKQHAFTAIKQIPEAVRQTPKAIRSKITKKSCITGFGIMAFITLSQGHAAHDAQKIYKATNERAIAIRKKVAEGKDLKLKYYYWKTQANRGICGHVSVGTYIDGKEERHFGHWPKDALGSSPISVIVPTAANPVDSLEGDIEREEDQPDTVITFNLTKAQAERAIHEMDKLHSETPCYSIFPLISKLFHEITRRLPAGPSLPRKIENCTTLATQVGRAAEILDEDAEDIIVPGTLAGHLQSKGGAVISEIKKEKPEALIEEIEYV